MELGVIIGCWEFDVRCSMFPWLMESLDSLLRMHWDDEPTPSPCEEGNREDADGSLLPSWEGSGVGRFMERRAVFIGFPLSLTLSPLLRRGAREFAALCRVSQSLPSNTAAKS